MSVEAEGVPDILLQEKWDDNGTQKDNPLYVYKHQRPLLRGVTTDMTTHRYPYSSYRVNRTGIAGFLDGPVISYNTSVNQQNPEQKNNNRANQFSARNPNFDGMGQNYTLALSAPSYPKLCWIRHIASRITRDDSGSTLEDPHDSGHVVWGTTDSPQFRGDMISPDYAAYDPVFWLHHCFIDYVFDVWWNSHTISKTDFDAQAGDDNRYILPFTPGSKNFNVWASAAKTIPYTDREAARGNTVTVDCWTVDDNLLAMLKKTMAGPMMAL